MKTSSTKLTALALLLSLGNSFGQGGGTLQFSTQTVEVDEAAGAAAITVVRSGPRSTGITVDFATKEVAAQAGRDFIHQSGKLTFDAGQTNQTFTIQILEDGFIEEDEPLEVVLSNPTNGSVLGAARTMTLTILDNERPGSVSVVFGSAQDSSRLRGIIEPLVVQADGSTLVGGAFIFGPASAPAPCAVSGWNDGPLRFNRDGSLDESWGAGLGISGGGLFGGFVHEITVQPDGKVLLGGEFTGVRCQPRNGVARLNADGTLDETFNPAGGASSPKVHSLALQPDGKLLVGGDFSRFNGVTRARLARLEPTGALDLAFNPTVSGGDFGGLVEAIALQADGKILIGGTFTQVNGTSRSRLARLQPDGTLDQTFTNAAISGSSWTFVYRILLNQDGKILIGGNFNRVGGQSRLGLARLHSNGTLDTQFDPKGFNGDVRGFALQPDGKVLVSGQLGSSGLRRLNADGSTDLSFKASLRSTFSRVGLQPDGGIVVASNDRVLRLRNDENLIRLVAQKRTADGQLQLGVNTNPGRTYVLESSVNLASWLPIQTNVAQSASWEFAPPGQPSSAHLFYRVLMW